MNLKVKLTYLDRQPALFYENTLSVFIDNDINRPIGTCEVYNEAENHFGNLKLDIEVSGELFFYYRGLHANDGYFYFSGLQFTSKPLQGKYTTQLKEMIV